MDLKPGRIGFMNTQRRENRPTPATKTCRRGPRDSRQYSCTEREEDSGPANLATIAQHRRAYATFGTAPYMLATNSLQSDHLNLQIVKQNIRRSSPPPGAGILAAADALTTHRSSLPFIPFSSGFASFHPTLPQFPAGHGRWMERYDGKRDLYLQHAA